MHAELLNWVVILIAGIQHACSNRRRRIGWGSKAGCSRKATSFWLSPLSYMLDMYVEFVGRSVEERVCGPARMEQESLWTRMTGPVAIERLAGH